MMRVGTGWDIHLLVEGRRLVIGGVDIPSPMGEKAHSDGDVLLHAVIDALLGACALGDIGTYFPPSEERWKNADSRRLLRHCLTLVEQAGYRVENLDCTVILQSPKLAPHREAIRGTIAEDLRLPPSAISVKAKTKEGVDSVGRGEAVEAIASVLVSSKTTRR